MKEKNHNSKNNNSKNNHSITTVTFLTREQIDFLDKLGKDSLFKYGRKLSRAKILSELVNLLITLRVSVEDIDLDNGNLWEGLLKVIRNGNT